MITPPLSLIMFILFCIGILLVFVVIPVYKALKRRKIYLEEKRSQNINGKEKQAV
jgi:preprotein translocase subunit SecY